MDLVAIPIKYIIDLAILSNDCPSSLLITTVTILILKIIASIASYGLHHNLSSRA